MTDILGINGLVQFLIQRFERNSVPVQEQLTALNSRVDVLIANQKQLFQITGEIMATIEQQSAATQARIDAIASQNAKAFGEIKAKIAELSAVQVTPEELATAVDAAKAAQKETDEAEFAARVDAAFAPINDKLAAAATTSQELDDLVADVAPETPTTGDNGTGTGTETGTTEPTV